MGLETVPFHLHKYWKTFLFVKRILLALFSWDCYPYRSDFTRAAKKIKGETIWLINIMWQAVCSQQNFQKQVLPFKSM